MAKKVFEVIDLLEANGWTYQRTRGDHHIFKKDGVRRSIPVPGKRGDVVPPGVLNAILRESGIKIK